MKCVGDWISADGVSMAGSQPSKAGSLCHFQGPPDGGAVDASRDRWVIRPLSIGHVKAPSGSKPNAHFADQPPSR